MGGENYLFHCSVLITYHVGVCGSCKGQPMNQFHRAGTTGEISLPSKCRGN